MISDPEDRSQTQSLPQSAHDDTEQMQRPGTSSKHTAETAEVNPVAVAGGKRSRQSSAPVSTMTHLSSGSSASLPLMKSEGDKTAS